MNETMSVQMIIRKHRPMVQTDRSNDVAFLSDLSLDLFLRAKVYRNDADMAERPGEDDIYMLAATDCLDEMAIIDAHIQQLTKPSA